MRIFRCRLLISIQLCVLEEAKTITYVAYLASPIKSLDSFKIVWENHFQFLPEPFHVSSDQQSVAFVLNDQQIPNIESRASTFRINGTKV